MYSEFIEHELKDSIGALMDKDNLEDSMNPNIVFSIEQLFEKNMGIRLCGGQHRGDGAYQPHP